MGDDYGAKEFTRHGIRHVLYFDGKTAYSAKGSSWLDRQIYGTDRRERRPSQEDLLGAIG